MIVIKFTWPLALALMETGSLYMNKSYIERTTSTGAGLTTGQTSTYTQVHTKD